ncbi:MAG: hypothetical protein ACREXU_19520, partial [Gammaproteobacteria bacterium]
LRGREYDVFSELGISPDGLRNALNLLAYEAHRDQPELRGTHEIEVKRLVGVLYDAASPAGRARGEQRIVEYVTNRTGLLVERTQGEIYRFPHRTFQEYLAASHLTNDDFPFKLLKHLREDDQRWREAVMLAAAKTALSGTSSAIWWLIDAFCPEEWNPRTAQDADWYALLRAAQALIETEQHVSVIPRNEAKFDRLRHRLAALLESKDALMKALRDRAEAGCALASLRDTRDGVGLKPGSALPDVLWVPIPGTAEVRASGRYLGFDGFKLGEGLKEDPKFAQDNEKWPANAPAVDVAAFQLAAYPTTVAQFQPFVEGDGYENRITGPKRAGRGARGDAAARRPLFGTIPAGISIIIPWPV